MESSKPKRRVDEKKVWDISLRRVYSVLLGSSLQGQFNVGLLEKCIDTVQPKLLYTVVVEQLIKRTVLHNPI